MSQAVISPKIEPTVPGANLENPNPKRVVINKGVVNKRKLNNYFGRPGIDVNLRRLGIDGNDGSWESTGNGGGLMSTGTDGA